MSKQLLFLSGLLFVVSKLTTVNPALGEPLKIGVSIPLTGPGAYMGNDIRDGILLCKKNDNHKYIYEDHQNQPSVGITGFNKLVNVDKIDFGIVANSNVASALVPIAKGNNIPLFMTLVSSTEVATKGGKDALNFFSTGAQDGAVAAKLIVEDLKFKSVGVLYLNGEYGEAYRAAFETEEVKHNLSIFTETFLPGEVDVRTQLLKLVSRKPDILYLVGYDAQISTMLRQAREIGYKGKFASTWIITAPSVRKTDSQLYEGVFSTSPSFYFSNDPQVKEFTTNFVTKFNREPTAYAGIGCDIAKLLDTYAGETAKVTMEKLQQLNGFSGVMGELKIEADGILHFPLFPVEIHDGELKVRR